MSQEREVSVAEWPPFHKSYGEKRFFLANEAEREWTKSQWPEMVVRTATEEEKDQLQGKTWEQMEQEELQTLLRESR